MFGNRDMIKYTYKVEVLEPTYAEKNGTQVLVSKPLVTEFTVLAVSDEQAHSMAANRCFLRALAASTTDGVISNEALSDEAVAAASTKYQTIVRRVG